MKEAKTEKNIRTQSTPHSSCHDPFWEVHRICDSNNDDLAIHQGWPVEEVVNYILFGCDKLVEFVHQNHTGLSCYCQLMMVK